MAIVFFDQIQQPIQCVAVAFRHLHIFACINRCNKMFFFASSIECVWIFATMLRFFSKLTPTSHPIHELWNDVASEVCARRAHVYLGMQGSASVCVYSSSSSSTPWIFANIRKCCVLQVYFYTVILTGGLTIHEFGKWFVIVLCARDSLYFDLVLFSFFAHAKSRFVLCVCVSYWVILAYIRTLNRIFRNCDVEICFANVLNCCRKQEFALV